MTTRKRSKPTEITAPAIEPDEAFGNQIIAARDAAIVTQQALQSDRITREAYFDREIARLTAEWDAERKSLDKQIGQQGRILDSCDAALETLKGSNVVQLKAAAE